MGKIGILFTEDSKNKTVEVGAEREKWGSSCLALWWIKNKKKKKKHEGIFLVITND
uniref:Uncharacterized protein n=1 Tax=Nelumbo nucifera TaxID=4432 RepID=A0A822X9F7_NELNU|nr:TPA_asm: hypothetical protein HUJ06_019567 [Nelumbo nucifera]